MLESLRSDDYEMKYPRACLERPEQAWAVYDALSEKSTYEVIELCSTSDLPRDLLGFDVGYWGGGNFSILCDAAIWPIWHPPDLAALPDLARTLSVLNAKALFPTEDSAKRYRDWYAEQPWAEDDPSAFTIIAIGAVGLPDRQNR